MSSLTIRAFIEPAFEHQPLYSADDLHAGGKSKARHRARIPPPIPREAATTLTHRFSYLAREPCCYRRPKTRRWPSSAPESGECRLNQGGYDESVQHHPSICNYRAEIGRASCRERV